MNSRSFPIPNDGKEINRRQVLQGFAGATALGVLTALTQTSCASTAGGRAKAVANGRIKQSIAHWCFEAFGDKWTIEEMCRVANDLGCKSVELVSAKHYPILKKYGLTNAIVQIDMGAYPPFAKGLNNPIHHPEIIKATTTAIDAAAEYGFPNVICFNGYSSRDVDNPKGEQISSEEGAGNCVKGLKELIGYAEKKKVNLCMEILNTRVSSHPMKGHPGYQGDHVDYCVDIVKKVGSPRMKILFDVYHIQIMDGDIISRIHQYKDYIGHVHVAGNPGRNEIDDSQEINYRAVLKALLDVGYNGYVAHEFIPTRDPYQSLYEAVKLCDV